jgi:hypothetical protein
MKDESRHRMFLRGLLLFAFVSLLIIPSSGYPFLQRESPVTFQTERIYSPLIIQGTACFHFIYDSPWHTDKDVTIQTHYHSALLVFNRISTTNYLTQKGIGSQFPETNPCHYIYFTYTGDKGDAEEHDIIS